MMQAPALFSMPRIVPRRRLMSPIRSPWYSSGVVTSTPMMGSSRIGFAFFIASLNAKMPAILNASSDESTSWNDAVDDPHDDVDDRVPGDDAVVRALHDPVDRRLDELLRDAPAHRLVEDLDALALPIRLELDDGVAVLALAAGLADELALALRGRLVTVSR